MCGRSFPRFCEVRVRAVLGCFRCARVFQQSCYHATLLLCDLNQTAVVPAWGLSVHLERPTYTKINLEAREKLCESGNMLRNVSRKVPERPRAACWMPDGNGLMQRSFDQCLSAMCNVMVHACVTMSFRTAFSAFSSSGEFLPREPNPFRAICITRVSPRWKFWVSPFSPFAIFASLDSFDSLVA